jgi:hypothetical protein
MCFYKPNSHLPRFCNLTRTGAVKDLESQADEAAKAVGDLSNILDLKTTYYNAEGRPISTDSTMEELDQLDLFSSDEKGKEPVYKAGDYKPAYEAAAGAKVAAEAQKLKDDFYQLKEGVTYYDRTGNALNPQEDFMDYQNIYNQAGTLLRDGEKYEAALRGGVDKGACVYEPDDDDDDDDDDTLRPSGGGPV